MKSRRWLDPELDGQPIGWHWVHMVGSDFVSINVRGGLLPTDGSVLYIPCESPEPPSQEELSELALDKMVYISEEMDLYQED